MDNALLEKALEMPPNERVVLAEMILASIDYEEDGSGLDMTANRFRNKKASLFYSRPTSVSNEPLPNFELKLKRKKDF